MFLEVNIQQARKDWCIQMLKCNKQGTNNVFRSENVTNKIKLGYLKIKKQHVKYNRLVTTDIFRGENTTSKVGMIYLEVKIQIIGNDWDIKSL